MAGKGDRYRPVDQSKFNSNWDRIFKDGKSGTDNDARDKKSDGVEGGGNDSRGDLSSYEHHAKETREHPHQDT